MELQITMNEKDKLEVVYNILTTGLPYFPDFGFELDFKKSDYNAAQASLIAAGKLENDICMEDVQTEMIRMGFDLKFNDVEGEGDNDAVLNLALIQKNWDKIRPSDLVDMVVKEDWDANTADCIMQCILFGEIVYG